MPNALAFRYARALADLAARPGVDLETLRRELDAFTAALAESEDLRTALESPAVTPPRKRAVISRMAALLPISDLVRRFLLVVVDHRRVALLREIGEAFEAVIDNRLGVVRADVLSARELTAQQREQLLAGLGKLTGRQVRARFAVDEKLIGGVVARIGSTVYDGSVHGQLQALRHRLAGAGA